MGVMIVKKPASEIAAAGPKPKVMGVDPSTHTGIVILHGEKRLYTGVVEAPENVTGYSRLHSIAQQVVALAADNDVDFLFIERPITSGKFNNQIQMQIATAVRLTLHQSGRGWYDVSPTTLKKWASGSGKSDKKQMRQAVCAKWGFDSADDNEVDAYALARLAQYVISKGLLTTYKGVDCGNS